MLLQIFPRDDETGILDGEIRDGDVFAARPDSDEVSLGGLEKKAYLFLKVPDPPNLSAFLSELGKPEYLPAPGSSSTDVRYARKYRVEWRTKFTAAEIAHIEDSDDQLQDGTTAGGGFVTAGVVADLFTVNDLIRK